MKTAFAVAVAVLAIAAYTEADGKDYYRRESVYNKNTNINTSKNKDKAEVWSSIWDALFSSQLTVQQQEQLQRCFSEKTCAPHFFQVAEEEFLKNDDKDGDYKVDEYEHDIYDKDCSGEQGRPCAYGYGYPRFTRIYNVNTNKNYSKNKVAADVWSRIIDRLASYQTALQSEAQKQ